MSATEQLLRTSADCDGSSHLRIGVWGRYIRNCEWMVFNMALLNHGSGFLDTSLLERASFGEAKQWTRITSACTSCICLFISNHPLLFCLPSEEMDRNINIKLSWAKGCAVLVGFGKIADSSLS
jgi:hypothetical protein